MLYNFEADALVLCGCSMGTVFEALYGVVQGVDDVLGTASGGIAMRPLVFSVLLGVEDGVEGFGGGGGWNGGCYGKGPVHGEERGQPDVWCALLALTHLSV